MKSLFRILILTVAGLTSFIACADEATKAAKIDEFLRLAKIDEMLQQALTLSQNQFKTGTLQEIFGVNVPPEAEKRVEAFQEKLSRILMDALSWEKLKADYIKLYADTFTEAEVDDIVSFYKSSTGRSMVAKTPQLMTKSNEIVQQRMMTTKLDIQKLMKDFMAEMAANPPQD